MSVETKIHFLDVPFDELLERLKARNTQAPDEVTIIPLSMMNEYSLRFEPPDTEELAMNTR